MVAVYCRPKSSPFLKYQSAADAADDRRASHQSAAHTADDHTASHQSAAHTASGQYLLHGLVLSYNRSKVLSMQTEKSI